MSMAERIVLLTIFHIERGLNAMLRIALVSNSISVGTASGTQGSSGGSGSGGHGSGSGGPGGSGGGDDD